MSLLAPSVSVIIPAYRVTPYIAEALQSVIKQSYTDYEIILVDQDRDDGMARAIAPFAERIIQLTIDPVNASVARNHAIRHARGRYIALLDGDDCWLPHFLARLVPMLEAKDGPDVAYPNAVLFGRSDCEGVIFQNSFPSRRPVDLHAILTRDSYVFGGLVFRREIFDRVGGYDESLNSCEDLDLWLRIAANGGRFDFTSETLVRYRVRPGSASKSGIAIFKTLTRIYAKYLDHSDGRVREIAEAKLKAINGELQLETSKEFIAAGRYAEALPPLRAAKMFYGRAKITTALLLLRTCPVLLRWVVLRARLRVASQYREA